ncbi:MAG: hypothetical protein JWR58_5501 [Pseudonocardia sp.]|jgi:hypothetical protein|nr:hypothetical protein [Pseudonocardia sp.]
MDAFSPQHRAVRRVVESEADGVAVQYCDYRFGQLALAEQRFRAIARSR